MKIKTKITRTLENLGYSRTGGENCLKFKKESDSRRLLVVSFEFFDDLNIFVRTSLELFGATLYHHQFSISKNNLELKDWLSSMISSTEKRLMSTSVYSGTTSPWSVSEMYILMSMFIEHEVRCQGHATVMLNDNNGSGIKFSNRQIRAIEWFKQNPVTRLDNIINQNPRI